jgi:hypothetical protein
MSVTVSTIVIKAVYQEPIALFVCILCNTCFVQIQEQAVLQEKEQKEQEQEQEQEDSEKSERIRTAT